MACLDGVVNGRGHVRIGPSPQDDSRGTWGEEERGKSSLEKETNTPAYNLGEDNHLVGQVMSKKFNILLKFTHPAVCVSAVKVPPTIGPG